MPVHLRLPGQFRPGVCFVRGEPENPLGCEMSEVSPPIGERQQDLPVSPSDHRERHLAAERGPS